MGQSQSQHQEEESSDPKDEIIGPDLFQSKHPASDDFVFSSQISSSINPNFTPRGRSTKLEKYSSSPASHLRSSQTPGIIASHNMADSSPHHSPNAVPSSINVDVDNQADQHGNLTHLVKKKRRNKKRSSSASQLDNDPLPLVAHSVNLDATTYDGEQQQSNTNGNVVDVANDIDIADVANVVDIVNAIVDSTRISAEGQEQSLSQQKSGKKGSRRATKLARQQAATAILASETNNEPSRIAETWDGQEHAVATNHELEAEENNTARFEKHTDPPSTTAKKRKRRSQTNVEGSLEQSSKKHKHTHSSVNVDEAEDQGAQAQMGAVEGAEASPDNGISLNALAEQLYSDRKRKPHRDVIQEQLELSEPDVAKNSKQEHEYEEPVEVMDIDGEGGRTMNEAAENQATDETEIRQYDNIDYEYHDDKGANVISSLDEELPIDPMLTQCQPSASMESVNGLAPETGNDEFITTGITPGAGRHEEQNGATFTEEFAPSHITSPASEEAEVPSSVPHPSSAGESSMRRRKATKASTGRKRVAKPDFFSRVANDVNENTDVHSPTTAALSRKKGKGKQIVVSEDESQAGPSTINGSTRQPKITSMLKDGESVDGEAPTTPSSGSAVRVPTPRTPATLSGAFSDFEIRNLSQAIERYRDDHQMTQHEVNALIHGNPRDSGAGELWDCIMATCPNRSRQKVINQTRRRFHNFVARGTWTPEQEQELKEMYEMHGTKYSLIGTLINRHPEDIRDRIRNYIICGDKQRKDQWSPEETQKLIAIVEQAITEIRQQRAKRNLDDSRPVEEDISWQLVSQGMDRTRSRLQCMSKWKAIKPHLVGGGLDGELAPIEEIIQQARETATTMSYKNRCLILQAIYKTGASADSRIPWLRVRNELGLKWTRPPLMVVWFRLRRTVSNWQSLNVKEICTILLQDFQHTHKLEYPDEDNTDVDYTAEYREIEHKIKRGRKANALGKTSATIDKFSDDEDEEEEVEEEEEEAETIRDQFPTTGEKAEEETGVSRSRRHRPSSVDLGAGTPSQKQPEIDDSEPETNTRSSRRRRARPRGSLVKPQGPEADQSDQESSDTNASQVSSIPAH
jgi:hypothetical protein